MQLDDYQSTSNAFPYKANGSITDVVERDGTMFVAGTFTQWAADAPSIGCSGGVQVDLDTADIDWCQYPNADAGYEVYTAVPDGAGGWFVGGWFEDVGGTTQDYLAHVLADGTVDASWGDDLLLDDYVWRMTLANGVLYVGGGFTSAGGQTRDNLLAVDPDTGDLLAWNPGADGSIDDIVATPDGVVYVTGSFTTLGGAARQRIGALDAGTGAVLPWNPGINNNAWALAVDATRLYVGGRFTVVDGATQAYFAAFNRATGALTAWDPGFDDPVYALAVSAGTLYTSGSYGNVGGTPRPYFASFDLATQALTPWQIAGADWGAETLAVAAGAVYLAGWFGEVEGVDRHGFAAVDATTGALLPTNPGLARYSGGYQTAVAGDKLYFAGYLEEITTGPAPPPIARRGLAAIDVATGIPTAWNPDVDGSVEDLEFAGDDLWIGGTFNRVGNIPSSGVARFVAGSDVPSASAGTNGTVYELSHQGTRMYLAGSFTTVGTPTSSWIPIDATTAAVDDPYRVVAGTVHASVSDGAGGWYVAGDVAYVDGTPRSRIAHLLADRSLDPTFVPAAVDGAVRALVLHAGVLYAGGSFTSIAGAPRTALAALDPSTGALLPWSVSITAPTGLTVRTLAARGDSLYIGGSFITVAGAARRNLAEVTISTATTTAWDPGPNGRVTAVQLDAAGDLHAVGTFTATRRRGSSGYARFPLGSDRPVDAPVTSESDGVLDLSATTTYIGGSFGYAAGRQSGGWVPIDRTTADRSATFPEVAGSVHATVPDGAGGWYVGGLFEQVDGVDVRNAAHITAAGTVDAAWTPNPDGMVGAITLVGTTVVLGGGFESVAGQPRRSLAAVDSTTGVATAFNPGPDEPVTRLASSGTTLYVAGSFDEIAGTTRQYLASFDMTTGTLLPWNPTPNGLVIDMTMDGTTLYVSGRFTSIAASGRGYAAAFDTTTNTITTFDPVASNWITAIEPDATGVYIAGSFSTVRGTSRSRLARVTTAGAITAWSPAADSYVINDIEVAGTSVYLGGSFAQVNGQSRLRIAEIDTTTGATQAWAPGSLGDIHVLNVDGGVVRVGGTTGAVGDVRVHLYAAAIDTATNVLSTWKPSPLDYVTAIRVSGASVYVGGKFSYIGGQTRHRIARLSQAGTGPADAWNPGAGAAANTIQLDGSNVWIGGVNTSAGNEVARNGLAV